MNITINKKDLAALRRVLRHVSTSDTHVQNEAIRLDALLERILAEPKKETTHAA